MKRVLILCTGNSCRSQMAEALWKSLGGDQWHAESAGSHPSGFVHPLAIRAMQEIDIDISTRRSKSVDEFQDRTFDLVITVCDNAKDFCPSFSGARQILHWPFEDPADAAGSEEERMQIFRRVRDEIREQIVRYLGGSPS